VARVNAHRTGRGLSALAVSPALTAAAEWKARHMARYGYVEHDDPAPPVQRTPFERMQACGYPEALLAENIAAGYDSPASVMDAWLGSGGHRENIEHPQFLAIGVGVARSAGGTLYWTQDFGSVVDGTVPPPAPPPPPPPMPPQPDPAPSIGAAFGAAAAVRVQRCRRSARSPRTVVCRLVVSAAPVTLHARLRRRGATVARGSVRAQRAGPLRLRMRGRRPLRPGRATLRLRAGGHVTRRAVRVR